MRQRKANSEAVNKTFNFLNDVFEKCDGAPLKNYTLAELMANNNLSKSTSTACIKLGFYEAVGNGKYKWLVGLPTKEMALQVLEVLRLRNDKMVAIPLDGFESLVDTLQQLVISLKPKTDMRRDVGNYEKQIADKKHDDFLKIVCAIASNVYNADNIGAMIASEMMDPIHQNIITVSKDLLTKIYK